MTINIKQHKELGERVMNKIAIGIIVNEKKFAIAFQWQRRHIKYRLRRYWSDLCAAVAGSLLPLPQVAVA